MQGLAFVSPPLAGADLREGASSLEQLAAVLRVTDPDIPKVLVFHDITALRGHEGQTWEQGTTGATQVCITQLQHPPDLTSSTSWQHEEEEEDKEGFQGWELCPMYQPWAQRADTS